MIFGNYDAIGMPSIFFFFDVRNESQLLLSKYEKVHQQKMGVLLSNIMNIDIATLNIITK